MYSLHIISPHQSKQELDVLSSSISSYFLICMALTKFSESQFLPL